MWATRCGKIAIVSKPTAEGLATFAIAGNQLQNDGYILPLWKPAAEGWAHFAVVETNCRRMCTFCRCGNQLQKDVYILPLQATNCRSMGVFVIGTRTKRCLAQISGFSAV